jgi:hypothetical protein
MTQSHFYNRHTRFFLSWVARALVIAYIFQIGAFDHHGGVDPSELVGVPNTSMHYHEAHCHGDVSGCADSTGLASTLIEQPMQVLAPAALAYSIEISLELPAEVTIRTLTPPPQV